MSIFDPPTKKAQSRKALDQFVHPLDVDPQSEEGLAVSYSGGGLIQKYISGHIGIAFVGSECAAGDAVQDGFILHVGHKFLNAVKQRYEGFRRDGFDSEKAVMLPQIIERGDMPKNLIPAFVSFYSFDPASLDIGDPLFRFHFIDSVQKVQGLFVDGEIGHMLRYYAIARNDRRHHEIDARPNRIDHRADIPDNVRIERLFKIGDKQFPISAIRIRLSDDCVWVSTLPIYKALFENWHLGLGPLDWD